ncbi:MAG: hypothetical protein C7B44_12020 [Sulfobacillus thermosulfidooxidans]|nr:MAG: hypothetical protein C7B44_12020 [Sulfobacillus thermosulfidooxidans]
MPIYLRYSTDIATLFLTLGIISFLFIIYRRGGSFQFRLSPLSVSVDTPDANQSTIHYPVLVRAMRDFATIVHLQDYQNLGKVYTEVLVGASRCGRGSENRVALMIVDDSGQHLVCKEGVRHSMDAKRNWRFNLDEMTPAIVAFKESRIYNCPDVNKDKLWKPLPNANRPTYQSFCCVPIKVEQKVWGILNIDSPRRNAFNSQAEEDLKMYATVLGFVLELEYKVGEGVLHEQDQ